MNMVWLLVFPLIAIYFLFFGEKHAFYRSKLILIIYSGILLLAALIYPFLPVKAGEETDLQLISNQQLLAEATKKGEIDQLDRTFVSKKWTFPLEGKSLNVDSLLIDSDIYMEVYLEKTTNLTESIEVTLLNNRLLINDENLLKSDGVEITFNNGNFQIRDFSTKEIKIHFFTPSLITAQFHPTENSIENSMNKLMDTHQNEILYIRVPENTVITGDTEFINIVEKE